MNLYPYLAMGMLGVQEMAVIFLMVLLLFGAKKIPDLARGIGTAVGEFKNAKKQLEREIATGEENAN